MYKIFSFLFSGVFLTLVLQSTAIHAQKLEFDEIKVIAPYEPTISDAFKINFNPRIEDTLKVNLQFDYTINPFQIPTRFQVEPISPARMRGEPLTKLYNGLVKAGIGAPTSPYLEGFYNSLRSNEYAYGVHVKHFSSVGGINDYGHSAYSTNRLNLHGRRFLENHTLSGDMDYQRQVIHYYGFRRDEYLGNQPVLDYIDELSKKDIRQRFHYFAPAVGFTSNYLDSTKLHHSLDLKYYLFTDRYDSREQNLNFRTQLSKKLPPDPLGFAEDQSFQLELGADYYHNRNLHDTTHTAVFRAIPTLSSRYKDFKFYVGLNTSVEADTATYLRLYPHAGAQVNLISDVLLAYASISGNVQKHNIKEMSSLNPFMLTSVPLRFQNNKSILQGGFKGSISSVVAYNLSVSNSSIRNYAFFVTDTSAVLQNQFDIIYDDLRLFNFKAEIFSQIGERVRLSFASDYYQYSLDNELEPWHEPSMRLHVSFQYNIQNKIIFSADAFARNSVYARSFNELGEVERRKIHGYHVDTNFGLEYRYTKILSMFLNFNNIQNQPLERWNNYPSQRFNIMGGVTYAF